jgi:hypothetical protein
LEADKITFAILYFHVQLGQELSDFVLKDAYRTMLGSFGSRGGLVRRWIAIPPPITSDALAALKKSRIEYCNLLERLNAAVTELNRAPSVPQAALA